MSIGIHSFTKSARSMPYSITTFHQIDNDNILSSPFSSTAAPSTIVPSAPMSYLYNNEYTTCSTACKRAQKILVCYTPKNAAGIVSCVSDRDGDALIFTTEERAVMIPSGAIIDSIEFFGLDNFSTKDVFSIGFGQLNQDITFPLVIDTDSGIANERVGGCRDFSSCQSNGANTKNIVIIPSYINVELNQPITSGSLQIVIRYHLRII